MMNRELLFTQISTRDSLGITHEERNSFQCRICLEEGKRADFIAPCSCAGSSKWVHRECLDRWRVIRPDHKAFSRCCECLEEYQFVCPSDTGDALNQERARRCRFICLLMRDFGIAIAVSLAVVCVFSLIVYSFDAHSHALRDLLHMQRYPRLCYLALGLCATFGLGFLILQVFNSGQSSNDRGLGQGRHFTYHRSTDIFCPYYYYSPVYISTPVDPAADCLCCCCCESGGSTGAGTGAGTGVCHGCCGGCCGDAAASAGGAGTSGEGCCSGLAATEVGHECLIVFVVVAGVLAVIGVFVCILLGVAYAQHLVRTHWRLLDKSTLAQDFIVADLAPLPVAPPTANSHAPPMVLQGDVEVEMGNEALILSEPDMLMPTAPMMMTEDEEHQHQLLQEKESYSNAGIQLLPRNTVEDARRSTSSSSSSSSGSYNCGSGTNSGTDSGTCNYDNRGASVVRRWRRMNSSQRDQLIRAGLL